MTRELENHQAMIQELRQLRERDAREMRTKIAEVDSLRREVERLAGEVDNLRLVVEDGLRERELRRERSDAESETASVRSASPQWAGQDGDELSPVAEERTNEMRAEQEDIRGRRGRERIPRHQRERAPSRSMGDNDWAHHTNGAAVGSQRPTRFIDVRLDSLASSCSCAYCTAARGSQPDRRRAHRAPARTLSTGRIALQRSRPSVEPSISLTYTRRASTIAGQGGRDTFHADSECSLACRRRRFPPWRAPPTYVRPRA